jgi:hypothetical protein
MMSDNAKIGTLLVSLGFLFLFLGVLLFFDAGLMAIGACAARCLAGRALRGVRGRGRDKEDQDTAWAPQSS